MRFRPPRTEPPEINLIPFIDVLLVILIFLMLSTTYSKFTELQITLPSADAEQLKDRPKEVIVGIAADGRFVVHTAEARALVLATEGACNAASERGLADTWRAKQTEDGALHLLFQLPDGQVFENPFLDFLEVIMILVQDLGRGFQIEVVR